MTAHPDRAVPGEPVTFTITKTNLLPSDLACTATSRQETCQPPSWKARTSSGDLGTILAGESVTVDVTVSPTIPREITSYAADRGESLASASVTVVTVPENAGTTTR